MDKGLIKKSKSLYASRISLAPKGDTWRMCCNYAPVNKKIKKDRHPLQNIEDVFGGVSNAIIFSTLDALSGFQ